MSIRPVALFSLAIWSSICVPAQAHFLWIVSGSSDKSPTARVYFSESASPDDPDLLDRVLKAEAFAVPERRGEPQPLKLEKKDAALVAHLTPEQSSAPVVLRHAYGVMSRAGETFLLKYYAKTYPYSLPGTWAPINDAELLPLEVIPVQGDGGMALKTLWQGKYQAGVTITIEGPGLEKKIEGTTDEGGVFRCQLVESGTYSIRAKFVEAKDGEFDKSSYKSVRHYSTLALPYLAPQLQKAAHNWPELPRGITSFGGAIAGDWLYVYGGHYGKAHEYSSDDQSGDFRRLNLRDPQQWELLPGGPKLTGPALVAHQGKLYRVGGFTAKNSAAEDESLWSQSDFARFDPQTKQWESLPALPDNRSSHDACVMGNLLYVAGGWEMQGGEKKWHKTAWAVDLSTSSPEWKPLAPAPFHRRAVALAAWQGKIYCLGGMQPQGGATTAVAIYDPARHEWTQGPALLGTGMDGFGSSAFACGGRLYATTMSGSIQALSAGGQRWEYAGQLEFPRFFHRLLPWNDDCLVVVGGARMLTGKILALEKWPVKADRRSAAK